MRRLTLTAVVVLSGMALGRAQSPTEFVGTLEPLAVPGPANTSIVISSATSDALAKLGRIAATGAKVWVGDLTFGAGKQQVFLIEPAGDGLAVALDLDGNATIEAQERRSMTPEILTAASGVASPFLATTVRIPTPGAVFPDFPVTFRMARGSLSQPPGGESAAARVYLQTSYQAFATGTVPIDGKPVKVKLIVNAKDFTVDPSKSYQYVDCNGDGGFDTGMTSWEMGYGHGAPVVFHLDRGDRYVSIKGVDVTTRTITLASRTAADYERIELRLGSTLPDFAFKALDGSPRHLSDFRGKYLIMDFWGTWCGPCVGEIPFLKKAYETYKGQGLEILGMDFEQPDVTPEDFAKGLEGVKKFVADKGVTWTQAQTESIKPLYDRRFQIVAWPTIVLLDPNGVVLSVDRASKGEPGLRGDRLAQTLAAIFKKTP